MTNATTVRVGKRNVKVPLYAEYARYDGYGPARFKPRLLGNALGDRRAFQTRHHAREFLNTVQNANKRQWLQQHLDPPLPPMCEGQTVNFSDPNSCIVQGLRPFVEDMFSEDAVYDKEFPRGACDPRVTRKQPHQLVAHEIAKLIVHDKAGDHRGLLVWNNTGSGKTATALGIALAAWDTAHKIWLVTTPANKDDNNLSIYAANLCVFWDSYIDKIFKNTPPPPRAERTLQKHKQQDSAFRQWCDGPGMQTLSRRIRTMTFVTMASEMGMRAEKGRQGGEESKAFGPSGKAVFIIDEAQSIFKPDDKDDYKPVTEKLQRWLMANIDRTYTFALTATPGESIAEYVDVLSMVRRRGTPPFTAADAATPSKFRGLVAFADVRGDLTRHATMDTPGGRQTPRNVTVEMDPRYYAAYLTAFAALDETLEYESEDLSDKKKFMTKTKQAGNFLALKFVKPFFAAEELARFEKAAIPIVIDGKMVSEKMRRVAEAVTKLPGKHYVYMHDLATTKVFMLLLDKIGFQNTTIKMAKKILDAPKRARYLVFKSGTINKEPRKQEELSDLKLAFSNDANTNGEYIKIFIATEGHFQGVDLKALRGVHIVDPMFNKFADDQVVGRGIRMCAHDALPRSDRNVRIVRYFSTAPQKFRLEEFASAAKGKLDGDILGRMRKLAATFGNPDAATSGNVFVYEYAKYRDRELNKFENVLRGQAVDCALFYEKFHKGRYDFTCAGPSAGSGSGAREGTKSGVPPPYGSGRSAGNNNSPMSYTPFSGTPTPSSGSGRSNGSGNRSGTRASRGSWMDPEFNGTIERSLGFPQQQQHRRIVQEVNVGLKTPQR